MADTYTEIVMKAYQRKIGPLQKPTQLRASTPNRIIKEQILSNKTMIQGVKDLL
jgi:hypothetical protein